MVWSKKTIKNGCDDPYRMLANNLVVTSSDIEIHRYLHQAKAIKRRIYRETKDADFYGDFLDCIVTEIISQGKKREIDKRLPEVADFFYRSLDIPRLRENIRYYLKYYGKDIE